jgi:type IV fimbrial biogenesis protein FimT
MSRQSIKSSRNNQGFSLIEMMIVVVIFAILAAVGAPALQRYNADNRTLATAQAFQAGLQAARAEAIRRNANVDFQVTNDVAFLNATPASTDASGRNWVVRTVNLVTPANFDLVDSRVNDDPAQRVAVDGNSAVVTFGGLGTLVSAQRPAVFGFSHQGYTCAVSGGDFRCKQVRVGAGGQIQLCDPAVPATATGDSRRCL